MIRTKTHAKLGHVPEKSFIYACHSQASIVDLQLVNSRGDADSW